MLSKPWLVDVVGWQQRGRVDLEGEEVSNRVGVLGPIETMKGLPSPWVRVCGRKLIDFRFEPSGQ